MKSRFPKDIKPMLATLVDLPPKEKDWLYEIKWDGYRAIAYCKENKVNLISRNNKSFNTKFYPIINALEKMQLHAVLDGEIIVLDDEGRSNFADLQNWRSEADGQLIYYVFDVLWLYGYNLLHVPLVKRKEILKKLLPSKGIIRESSSYPNAKKLFSSVKKAGFEGIIAKKSDSIYSPGLRSRHWLKIKVQKRQEVVIGGYTQNKDTPKLFSSLLVGVFDEEGSLEYFGKIGTGFNDEMQKEIMKKLKPFTTRRCPFVIEPDVNTPSRFRPNPPIAKVTWLQPKVVCEVSYTERSEGAMRHASFEGIREDKNAKNVHEEVAEPLKSPSPIKIAPIKKERKTLLNPKEDSQTKNVNGSILKFTNLNKIFWPKEKFSKRDMLNYYYLVAPYILPYLKNRPQSLNRFPNGINGQSFYQKDVTTIAPDWIKQFPYHTSDGKDKNYIVVQNEQDLLWMANLGAIEMNPWNSTIEKPDNPTWCIIDIDPTEKNTFAQVIKTALVTKEILDALKITAYCKTSGSTGLHIYIPLHAKYTYDECQLFARKLATQVHHVLPQFTSIDRFTVNRKNKIYIDFLQNRPKATLAAPYSVRPKPGAPVSMPLHWDEVKSGLKILQFTLKNAIQRIQAEGDLFKPVLGSGFDLKKAMKALEAYV